MEMQLYDVCSDEVLLQQIFMIYFYSIYRWHVFYWHVLVKWSVNTGEIK